MRILITGLSFFMLTLFVACNKDNDLEPEDPTGNPPTCTDGVQNGDETGIDCGGETCDPCISCQDGIMNGDEFTVQVVVPAGQEEFKPLRTLAIKRAMDTKFPTGILQCFFSSFSLSSFHNFSPTLNFALRALGLSSELVIGFLVRKTGF